MFKLTPVVKIVTRITLTAQIKRHFILFDRCVDKEVTRGHSMTSSSQHSLETWRLCVEDDDVIQYFEDDLTNYSAPGRFTNTRDSCQRYFSNCLV